MLAGLQLNNEWVAWNERTQHQNSEMSTAVNESPRADGPCRGQKSSLERVSQQFLKASIPSVFGSACTPVSGRARHTAGGVNHSWKASQCQVSFGRVGAQGLKMGGFGGRCGFIITDDILTFSLLSLPAHSCGWIIEIFVLCSSLLEVHTGRITLECSPLTPNGFKNSIRVKYLKYEDKFLHIPSFELRSLLIFSPTMDSQRRVSLDPSPAHKNPTEHQTREFDFTLIRIFTSVTAPH